MDVAVCSEVLGPACVVDLPAYAAFHTRIRKQGIMFCLVTSYPYGQFHVNSPKTIKNQNHFNAR